MFTINGQVATQGRAYWRVDYFSDIEEENLTGLEMLKRPAMIIEVERFGREKAEKILEVLNASRK